MYPLPVLRSFGKLLNPVLCKQKPFRCRDFAAHEAPQGMRAFYDQWRHGFLLEASGSVWWSLRTWLAPLSQFQLGNRFRVHFIRAIGQSQGRSEERLVGEA